MFASTGIGRRSARASCGSRRSGRARNGAASSSRASARKPSSNSSKVIRTVRSWSAPSTTKNTSRPTSFPTRRPSRASSPNSTKGGGGYNEWQFEDKKGSEKIGLHAEKDYELVIRHAETRTIGETFGSGTSRDTTIKNGDDELDIRTDSQNVKISKDQTIDVQKTIKVTANISIELKVGASKILLEQSGITIEAPTINIKSLGPMVVKGTPININ